MGATVSGSAHASGQIGRRDLNEGSHFAIADGTSSIQSTLIGQLLRSTKRRPNSTDVHLPRGVPVFLARGGRKRVGTLHPRFQVPGHINRSPKSKQEELPISTRTAILAADRLFSCGLRSPAHPKAVGLVRIAAPTPDPSQVYRQ